MFGPERFTFLNETHDLSEGGWNDPRIEKLWLYNLHYFDDLNARSAEDRSEWHRALIDQWVSENPLGDGNGWEPYPVSLRIVNWVKWFQNGNRLSARAIQSLGIQARWLSRKIEWHLLGNHLLVNAKALIFAGVLFEGEEAGAWLRSGLEILQQQIPEQILGDGAHFELSPMYHSLVLEDLLDLLNLFGTVSRSEQLQQSVVATIRGRIPEMIHWLRAMTHPDGEISFFNDASFDVAPKPAAIEEYANRLGIPREKTGLDRQEHFAESGYVRVTRPAVAAILDVAQTGPDYLQAHSHADTLSFELSIFGERVFVNSGTSRYGADPERLRQRGTAAHNTVVINGKNSSEVWDGFRVARRARPFGLAMSEGDTITVSCSHDGYRRLTGSPIHTRTWRFAEEQLEIVDSISGHFRGAEARFHVHPKVALETNADAGSVTLRLANGRIATFSAIDGTVRIENSTWHPGFGVSEKNQCIAVEFLGPTLTTRIRWA